MSLRFSREGIMTYAHIGTFMTGLAGITRPNGSNHHSGTRQDIQRRWKDETSILILALQGTHLGASALQSHLYSAFRRERITYFINILVQPRRSLNTLCAELFLLAEPQVITWGLALQEVHARALASQQKVRLELAFKLLVRVNPHFFHPLSPSQPEEYPANKPQHQDTRSALARLSHFVRIHAFPKPYSRNDLGI